MEMVTLLLVAVGVLLYAPTGSSGVRFHPTTNQAVMSAINKSNSTRQEMGRASTPGDRPGSAGNWFAVQETEYGGGYHGFVATLDVYGFSLNAQQLSRACIWVKNIGDGAATSLNSIMIGWEVSPFLYGDSKTHFVTSWTRDGYRTTGCYNTKCSGFEPASGATIAPGGVIETVSNTPNGVKQNLTLKLVKDNKSGDWLVHYGLNKEQDPELIGRFPKSIFTGLADKATDIHFGGLAGSSTTSKPPPPMGNGFLPPAAASFRNIQLINRDLNRELARFMTDANLYPITPVVNGAFFYGGPSKHTAA